MRTTIWLAMTGVLLAGCQETTFSPLTEDEEVVEEPGPPPTAVTTLSIELDYTRADVSFLVDTTGSMSGLANALAAEFGEIAASLYTELPESSFGVAMYRDYNHGGMGSGQDKPFHLMQQQTTDLALVQSAFNNLVINGGDDWAESTVEALYQAASGKGFDQNCNGAFDSADDVRPFFEDGSDVFGGTVPGYYQDGVEGSGEAGGMGYRIGSVPIIIYGTDAPLRDVENYGTPPGSCFAATREMAAGAVNNINGLLIGVNVSYDGNNQVTSEMQGLAALTDSTFEDGLPAVVEWSSGSDPASFRAAILDAVVKATSTLEFDNISVVVLEDPADVLVRVVPDELQNVARGETHDFEITVQGSIVAEGAPGAQPLTIALATPDGTYLTVKTVWVVPA